MMAVLDAVNDDNGEDDRANDGLMLMIIMKMTMINLVMVMKVNPGNRSTFAHCLIFPSIFF